MGRTVFTFWHLLAYCPYIQVVDFGRYMCVFQTPQHSVIFTVDQTKRWIESYNVDMATIPAVLVPSYFDEVHTVLDKCGMSRMVTDKLQAAITDDVLIRFGMRIEDDTWRSSFGLTISQDKQFMFIAGKMLTDAETPRTIAHLVNLMIKINPCMLSPR